MTMRAETLEEIRESIRELEEQYGPIEEREPTLPVANSLALLPEIEAMLPVRGSGNAVE